MKYILYDTEEEWDENNESMNAVFGFPDTHGNERYAEKKQVLNESNSDFGKYIFPITTKGSYVTIDKFNVNDMTEFDSSWFDPNNV